MSKLLVLLLLFMNLAFGLQACVARPWEQKSQIRLQADHDANDGIATAMDIVFVYDEHLAMLLPKVSPAWFSQKASLMYGNAATLDVLQLQMPAGTPLYTLTLPSRHPKAKYIYSYVNYRSVKGQSVTDLKAFECVVITLTREHADYARCP